MSTTVPRVHMCFGSTTKHLAELRQAATMYEGVPWGGWTVEQSAEPDDSLVFYMIRPLSCFVATGVLADKPWLNENRRSKWYGRHIANIKNVWLLSRSVPISEAKLEFFSWRFLWRPQVL